MQESADLTRPCERQPQASTERQVAMMNRDAFSSIPPLGWPQSASSDSSPDLSIVHHLSSSFVCWALNLSLSLGLSFPAMIRHLEIELNSCLDQSPLLVCRATAGQRPSHPN